MRKIVNALLDAIEQQNDKIGKRLDEICAEDMTHCDCGKELIVTTTPEGDETTKNCPDGCMEVTILHAW